MGCIYGIQNTIDGKWYIGQTTHAKPNSRTWRHFAGYRSSRYLQNAMQKYGKENCRVVTFEKGVERGKLDDLEIRYIAEYDAFYPQGYNLTKG